MDYNSVNTYTLDVDNRSDLDIQRAKLLANMTVFISASLMLFGIIMTVYGLIYMHKTLTYEGYGSFNGGESSVNTKKTGSNVSTKDEDDDFLAEEPAPAVILEEKNMGVFEKVAEKSKLNICQPHSTTRFFE
jgi:hypothetical protein